MDRARTGGREINVDMSDSREGKGDGEGKGKGTGKGGGAKPNQMSPPVSYSCATNRFGPLARGLRGLE